MPKPDWWPEEAPILDSMDAVEEVFYAMDNQSIHDRERPYNGQPWTDEGERGRQEIRDITMRDLSDCIALGILQACRGFDGIADSPEATWNDVFNATTADPGFNPMAACQNALCEVERRMGIFPNVPDLHQEEEPNDEHD